MTERISLQAWIVCLTASLFFFYEFIQMHIFNAISMFIMQEYSLTAVQLGNLSAVYFYSNVLFLFSAGYILDRYSTKRVILIALSVCIFGTALFAVVHELFLAAAARFLTAIGSAFCFLGCIRLASRWFPTQRLALITGLIVAMAMLGGMVAQTPLTLLVEQFGWREALLIDAGLGIVILLAIFFVVKDYPEHYIEQHKEHKTHLHSLGVLKSFRLAFLRKQNWLCGSYTSLLNLPIFVLGGVWGIQYLVNVRAISNTEASLITSMLFIGTVIGSPAMGWLSDKIGRRKLLMSIGAILSLIVILIAMLIPQLTFPQLLVLFLLLGFFTSTQVISYPVVTENNPLSLTATAVSIVSISCLSGGFIAPPIFGWLMDLHWNGMTAANGTPIYTAEDYQLAIWILPIAFIIGLVISFFIKENKIINT